MSSTPQPIIGAVTNPLAPFEIRNPQGCIYTQVFTRVPNAAVCFPQRYKPSRIQIKQSAEERAEHLQRIWRSQIRIVPQELRTCLDASVHTPLLFTAGEGDGEGYNMPRPFIIELGFYISKLMRLRSMMGLVPVATELVNILVRSNDLNPNNVRRSYLVYEAISLALMSSQGPLSTYRLLSCEGGFLTSETVRQLKNHETTSLTAVSDFVDCHRITLTMGLLNGLEGGGPHLVKTCQALLVLGSEKSRRELLSFLVESQMFSRLLRRIRRSEVCEELLLTMLHSLPPVTPVIPRYLAELLYLQERSRSAPSSNFFVDSVASVTRSVVRALRHRKRRAIHPWLRKKPRRVARKIYTPATDAPPSEPDTRYDATPHTDLIEDLNDSHGEEQDTVINIHSRATDIHSRATDIHNTLDCPHKSNHVEHTETVTVEHPEDDTVEHTAESQTVEHIGNVTVIPDESVNLDETVNLNVSVDSDETINPDVTVSVSVSVSASVPMSMPVDDLSPRVQEWQSWSGEESIDPWEEIVPDTTWAFGENRAKRRRLNLGKNITKLKVRTRRHHKRHLRRRRPVGLSVDCATDEETACCRVLSFLLKLTEAGHPPLLQKVFLDSDLVTIIGQTIKPIQCRKRRRRHSHHRHSHRGHSHSHRHSHRGPSHSHKHSYCLVSWPAAKLALSVLSSLAVALDSNWHLIGGVGNLSKLLVIVAENYIRLPKVPGLVQQCTATTLHILANVNTPTLVNWNAVTKIYFARSVGDICRIRAATLLKMMIEGRLKRIFKDRWYKRMRFGDAIAKRARQFVLPNDAFDRGPVLELALILFDRLSNRISAPLVEFLRTVSIDRAPRAEPLTMAPLELTRRLRELRKSEEKAMRLRR